MDKVMIIALMGKIVGGLNCCFAILSRNLDLKNGV